MLAGALAAQLAGAATFEDELLGVATFGGRIAPTRRAAQKVEQIIRTAVRTADFVVTSTTPGFTYEFDFAGGQPVRRASSRGPVFVESAETIGAQRLDLGITYLFANFTELDGQPLDDALDEVRVGPLTALSRVRDFGLRSSVLYFSGTYGLSSRWDVNLLLPLLVTTLDLDVLSGLAIPGQLTLLQTRDSHVGPGDLLLRTKYRLPDRVGLEWAGFFVLRLPSGSPAYFQGLGDVTLTPGVAITRLIGPHDVHANLAMEVNADDLSRSRVRYALGATLQPWPWLALIADAIGSSGVADDSFEEQVTTITGTVPVTGAVPRTDLVDLAVSFKITLTDNLLLHLGAIVPLTDDGIRAPVVPAGGIEATF